jgi:hypothetical protein
MRDVERRLTLASVEITSVDPEHPGAQSCLAQYVAELNRRSSRGFDPSRGATALPHEVRPPAGEFFVAFLHGEPVARRSLTSRRAGSWSRRWPYTALRAGARWRRSTTSRSPITGLRRR